MPFLYYWTRDRFLADNQTPLGSEELAFAQNSPVMRDIRDTRLWVFTLTRDDVFVLAASVMVSQTVEQQEPSGQYRIVAVPGTSRRFRLINPTVDLEPVLRSLSIAADWHRPSEIGKRFRGHNAVKRLSSSDDALLEAFSAPLKHASVGMVWRL